MVLSRRRTEDFQETDFEAVLPEEGEKVRTLYAAGIVRQAWLRGDSGGACFLVEAEDETDARGIVRSLPLAVRGLSEFTVIPLLPYRGFGPR
jgi:hypothetical protein